MELAWGGLNVSLHVIPSGGGQEWRGSVWCGVARRGIAWAPMERVAVGLNVPAVAIPSGIGGVGPGVDGLGAAWHGLQWSMPAIG